MKKVLLLTFISLIFSCSSNNQSVETNEGLKISKLESSIRYFNSVIQFKRVVLFSDEKYGNDKLYNQNDEIIDTVNFLYGSNGLCVAEEHFDANVGVPNNDSIYADYDNENRVIKITQSDRIIEFTYNNDQTITTTITHLTNSPPTTSSSVYYLNNEGYIYKYVNPGDAVTEIIFENNQVGKMVTIRDSNPGNMYVSEFFYDLAYTPKGYSPKNLIINTFGSVNNAILFYHDISSSAQFYQNNYIIKIDYATGQRYEAVYDLDSSGYTISFETNSTFSQSITNYQVTYE